MKRLPFFALVLAAGLMAILFAGCSRDPNVRKQKLMASGQAFFEQGRYREAAIQFANACDADPRFAEAHYQLARVDLKTQQWSRAFQELSRTLELQPDHYPAHIDIANLLVAGRHLKLAQEHVDLLLAKRPNDPLVHLAAANLLNAQQNFSEAIQENQKAIALDPSRADSYLSLALLQAQAKQPEAAESSFRKAIELDPRAVNARLALGGYYLSLNRIAEGEQQFRQAMAVAPHDHEPRSALARLYLSQGKKDQAEEFLKQSKADFPDDSTGYRMLGDFYFSLGDMDKALAEYASLYQDHPLDSQVKKNYVQLLIIKHRSEEARKLDDEILKSLPNDPEGLVYRGQLQLGDGHPDQAIATLQTAIKSDPDNGIAHFNLGVALDQQGNLQRAQSEWQEAARLRPDSLDVQRALASLALRKDDMSMLQQAADQIVRIQPTSPQGYVLRAVSFIKRAQVPKAEEEIRKAIEVAPGDPAGYTVLGNLRLLQKRYEDAVRSYRLALDRDLSSGEALSGLMNTDLAQKQVDKAIADANAQIAKAPGSSAFYDLLGTVLFNNKKDLAGAEAALTKAAELDRNNADALIKLGQVQVVKGSLPTAIETYERSVKDNPHQITFYILLGELYEVQHDSPKAKEAYQKALEIDANNALASNNLSYLILQTGGDVDEAVALAQTARRGTPDSPNAADTLAWAFYQKGYYQQSADLFQEALRLAAKANRPDNPNIHYHLGLAYQKIGDAVLARKELERVLQINPNYNDAEDVKKALARLRS
jgi:tetratricopeptide (TPR) repeat protein